MLQRQSIAQIIIHHNPVPNVQLAQIEVYIKGLTAMNAQFVPQCLQRPLIVRISLERMKLIHLIVVVFLLTAQKAQGWGGVHKRQWPWRDRQVPELISLDFWQMPKARVYCFLSLLLNNSRLKGCHSYPFSTQCRNLSF